MTICSKYPKELTHYDTQLKKKCFGKFKENVWEGKTKWRLMLKAQRNYHQKLISSTFTAWSTFSACQLRKRENLEMAAKYFILKTKRKAFSNLKRKAECRWALKKKLCNIRNFNLKKRAWNYWRKYLKKSKRSKEIYELTGKMRETYLVRYYIKIWFVNYTEKSFTEMKYLRAVIHYNFALKRQTFIEWINYRNQKHFKREVTSQFVAQLELKLKERVFTRLMLYTQHKKLYQKHVSCVTLFYETYLVRCVIDKWLVKYEGKVEARNREKNDLAVKFHEEDLLGRSLRKLRMWSDGVRERNEASNLFINIKIKLYLDLWRTYHRERLLSSALEEKARKWRNYTLKLIYLMKMVESFEYKRRENDRVENFIRFCDTRLMSETFRRFQQFLYIKRKRKVKYHSARHHCDTKRTRKCFRQLQTYAIRQIRKASFDSYNNCKLISKSFNKIKSYTIKKRFHQDCINTFQERFRLQILRRAFSILNDKTKNNRIKNFIAREVVDSKLKKKIFHQWKLFHDTKTQKNMVIHNSRLVLEEVIMRSMITQWWKKTQIRTTFKQDLSKVRSNQDRRLVGNYLKKWLNIIDKFRMLRENIKNFNEVHKEIIVQFYLMKVSDIWNVRRLMKEKVSLALRMEKRLLLKKHYHRWVTYTAWKKDKLKECSERILLQLELDKNGRCAKAKLRRKQPMIPVYLRERILPTYRESVLLDQFSNNETYDVSCPVSENLPVIY